MSERKPYPTDVSDEEWSFVALYLTLRKMRRTARVPVAKVGMPTMPARVPYMSAA